MLTDRAKGRHRNFAEACSKMQLLTPEQERTLIDWVKHRGEMGLPLSRKDLEAEAEAISGKAVGINWHRKFLGRHRTEICAAKSMKLDPKRASNFNMTVINDYFDKLEALHTRFPGGIPPEHIWNMDEKGIQMGGGRKNSNKKFFYMKNQKEKHRLKSDNLELVTVIECVSAAGDIVPLSFCMKSGAVPDLRDVGDDQWGR